MSIDQNIYLGSFLFVGNTVKNLHQLMLDKLKDEDLFCFVENQFLVPNRGRQGGIHINDSGVWEYPEKDFSHEDWKKIEIMLKEENITFEEKSGLIVWYN